MDRGGHEPAGMGLDEDRPGAGRGERAGVEPGQLAAGGGEDPAVEIAHRHVQLEIGVDLLKPPRQPAGIRQIVGREGGDVLGQPFGDLALHRAPLAEGEDQARREADDEEDAEEVEVDAGVESRHGHPSRRARR